MKKKRQHEVILQIESAGFTNDVQNDGKDGNNDDACLPGLNNCIYGKYCSIKDTGANINTHTKYTIPEFLTD